ncbi:LCP family protein [Amycolatopsis sp. NPDC059021]|uniref:LCP family protein n=1 Tax=Amycolatopsis sp. NPDC059021 TaxID=3346704 RepID=UPI0036735E35
MKPNARNPRVARRRHQPAHSAGRVLVALLSVVTLLVTGFFWNTLRQAQGLGASGAISGEGKAPDGSQNILLLGLTTRKDKNGQDLPPNVLKALHAGNGLDAEHSPDHQDHTGGYNTNTMILLHVPNDGSKATGISIPRDDYITFVDGPLLGATQGKIKEGYGWAKEQEQERLYAQGERDPATLEFKSREAGRTSTIKNVEHLLKVHVDHFAEISLAGFYHLADALGGVDVCLKEATKDDASGADFPQGPQHLNGEQALEFVRQRNGLPGDDLGRESRQQAFLASVASTLKRDGVFGSLSDLQKLLTAAEEDVVYDKGWNILDLAKQAKNLNPANIVFHTLPVVKADKILLGGQSVDINRIDVGQIQAAVQSWINPGQAAPVPSTPAAPPKPVGSGSTVDVRNASGVDNRAAELADAAAGHGFTKGDTSTVATQPESHVFYGKGAKADADALAAQLGISAVSASTAASSGHIAVYLGTDYHGLPAALGGTPATPSSAAGAPPRGCPDAAGAGGAK